jgi:hypothetical protein
MAVLRYSLRVLLSQLGATQSQMAMLLNISSTAVFNATRRRSKTPAKALILLQNLSEWLHAAEQLVTAQRNAPESISQTTLKYEHADRTLALFDAQRKLLGMERRYRKYSNAIAHLDVIQIPDSHPDHLLIRRWMEARRAEAQVRLRACSPEKQLHLRLRIAELEGALAYLNTLIVQEPPAAT